MSRSKLTRLTIGSQTYSPSGAPFQSLLFSSFAPNNRQQQFDIGRDLGGFGLLSHPVDITRNNVRTVTPRGRFKPSLAEWAELLPWLLNTVASSAGGTDTFNPGTVAKFRVLEYTDVNAVIHRLVGCAVSRATISAQAGQEVVLDLEIQGTDWSHPGSTTYPGLPLGTRFLFGDLALTLNGVPTPCRSWRLTIDHGIPPGRYYAGFVAADPINLDRTVTLDLEVPHGLATAARAAGQVDGGVAAVLTLTGVQYGVTSRLVFTLSAIRYEQPSPDANIPDEQFVAIQAQCFAPTVAAALQPEVVAALTQVV